MKAGNNISVHQLFETGYPHQLDSQDLNVLLKEYPYMAHLHWIDAFSKKEDENEMEEVGLYAFYPPVLQQCIENEALKLDDSLKRSIEKKESETEIKSYDMGQEEEKKEQNDLPTSNILQGTLSIPEKEKNDEEAAKPSTESENEIPNSEDHRTPQSQISAVQPLYTEDYFAYTQTKLPEEIENDKPPTMEQVNSFTGWLKKMKRPKMSPEEAMEEKETDEEEESKEDENRQLKNNEVVTASMAEIWEQYGDLNKAVEVYEKLILLNPEKKAYFAAKIKALKKQ